MKQNVVAILDALRCPDWTSAVVYDTRQRQNRVIGHRWDFDVFLLEARARERLAEPRGQDFHDPELWLKNSKGAWRRAAA